MCSILPGKLDTHFGIYTFTQPTEVATEVSVPLTQMCYCDNVEMCRYVFRCVPVDKNNQDGESNQSMILNFFILHTLTQKENSISEKK